MALDFSGSGTLVEESLDFSSQGEPVAPDFSSGGEEFVPTMGDLRLAEQQDQDRQMLELEQDVQRLERGGSDIIQTIAEGAEAAVGMVSKMDLITASSEFIRGAQGMVTGHSSPEIKIDQPLIPVRSVPDVDAGYVYKNVSGALGYSGKGQEIAQTLGDVHSGVRDAAKGLVEFMVTPHGVATLGSGLGPKTAQALLHTGFATQMSSHVPEAAEAVGEASVSGNTRDIARTGTELAFNIGAPALIVGAASRGSKPAPEPVKPGAEPVPKSPEEVIAETAPLTAKVATEIVLPEPAKQPAKVETAAEPKPLETKPSQPLPEPVKVSLEQPVLPRSETPISSEIPAFTKGQEVTSQRYGKGKVVDQVGGRVRVDFGDGSKFSVPVDDLRLTGTTVLPTTGNVKASSRISDRAFRPSPEEQSKAFISRILPELSPEQIANQYAGLVEQVKALPKAELEKLELRSGSKDQAVLIRDNVKARLDAVDSLDQLRGIFSELDKSGYRTVDSLGRESQKTELTEKPEQISAKTDPISEPLIPSPSDARLGIASVPDVVKEVPGFLQKHFTSEGNLPKQVHSKWIQSRAEITAEGREIAYNTRDLYRALAQNHGISTWQKLTRGMEDVPPEVIQRINEVMTGAADASVLAENVRGPVLKMREHVDSLSRTLIDRGLVDEQLQAKIGDNLGVYLTRSYRIFDDPKYAKNIAPDVLTNARNYIHEQMVKADPAATLDMADARMREMLADWSESGVDKQLRGGKLGSKDLTQFMQRKDIAPEIRALLGEYKDPVVNYARSATKIARFIADQEFLNEVRRVGKDKFLFEEGKAPKGFEYEIAAEGSSTMSPLNGLRTSKEIKEAFETFNKSEVNQNLIVDAWLKATAISKTSKTVGSAMTQARNLIGQPSFNVFNGHFDFTKYGDAAKAVQADTLGTNKNWQEYYKRMTRLGIVREGTIANELREAIREAGIKDMPDPQAKIATRLLRAGVDAPMRLYQLSDELGKIVGFENERATLAKAFPDWTPERLDTVAAERTRNTYPTYSMAPKAVQSFRRNPLVGPFVTFASEIFRTSYHNLRYAMEDLRSSNPEMRKAGAKRVAGIMMALGAGYAVSHVSRLILGIDDKTDQDIRRFLPRWDKNAQLVFTGKNDDGTYSYINWSYQNPYSYLTDASLAILSGADEKTLNDKMIEAAAEMFRPFTSEQIFSKALVDVMRNQTDTGRQIYNPEDPDRWQKIVGHLAESVEPGTGTRMREKIIPALKDEQPDYGRKLDPATEIMAEVSGIKKQNFSFDQAIQYRAREFRRDESNAEYLFNSPAAKQGTVTDQDLFQAYKDSDEARFKIWQRFHGDIVAARRNGVPQKAIESYLAANKVGADDIADLLRGRYFPYKPGPETIQKMRSLGRGKALDLIEDHRKSVIKKPLSE